MIKPYKLGNLLNKCLDTIEAEVEKINKLSKNDPDIPIPKKYAAPLQNYTKLLISLTKEQRESILSGTYDFEQLDIEEIKALAAKVGIEVPQELYLLPEKADKIDE